MSQISRPFQIALLAVAVLGAAWLFVFQPHTSNTASSSSSAAVVSSPPPSASAQANAAGAPSKIYHGSAPGVQGLTRAIAKAHGAVSASQQNASRLQQKAAQATGGTASAVAAPAGAHVTKSAAPAKSTPSSRSASAPASKAHAPTAAHAVKGIPAGQRAVESELAHGNVVVVLFWNHNGTDDNAVRRELRFLQTAHHKKVAINVASAKQTASFGAITRGVQIYGTPTMLVVNKHGKAIVLNGLQDAFSIEQAIDEARHAA
jgi:hypothetical protein